MILILACCSGIARLPFFFPVLGREETFCRAPRRPLSPKGTFPGNSGRLSSSSEEYKTKHLPPNQKEIITTSQWEDGNVHLLRSRKLPLVAGRQRWPLLVEVMDVLCPSPGWDPVSPVKPTEIPFFFHEECL